jgi:hypothetical protein
MKLAAALVIGFRTLCAALAEAGLINVSHWYLVAAYNTFMLHYAPFFNLI